MNVGSVVFISMGRHMYQKCTISVYLHIQQEIYIVAERYVIVIDWLTRDYGR